MKYLVLICSALVIACSETTYEVIPVASVQIADVSQTIRAGQTYLLTAHAFGPSGEVLAGRVFIWAGSQAGVATITSDGQLIGVGPGDVRVMATSEGVSGEKTFRVNAP